MFCIAYVFGKPTYYGLRFIRNAGTCEVERLCSVHSKNDAESWGIVVSPFEQTYAKLTA